MTGAVEIAQVPYGHCDVVGLTAEVQAYYEQIYGGPDSTPMVDDDFAPPLGAFFVGYAGDRPVAMGGWRFHRTPIDLPAKHPAEIKRMYVVEHARGRGFARLLLARLEETARASGADATVLETGRCQPMAISLYRSSGYADIPRFGYYACQPDSVHLGKPLSRLAFEPPLLGDTER